MSEIKLYNEQKVIEGRAQRNLYERLREYIDRSREMYDKRVKGGVSTKYDYFHHELVNTLAEGDASKLGEAYPGLDHMRNPAGFLLLNCAGRSAIKRVFS